MGDRREDRMMGREGRAATALCKDPGKSRAARRSGKLEAGLTKATVKVKQRVAQGSGYYTILSSASIHCSWVKNTMIKHP